MKAAKFWSTLDKVLTSIHADTKIYVYGPQAIGRACCNTCSVAEMLADVDETTEKEVSYLFYHDQEFERGEANAFLGWLGQDAVEEFDKRATKAGLVVIRPEGDHRKIEVKAPLEN